MAKVNLQKLIVDQNMAELLQHSETNGLALFALLQNTDEREPWQEG